MMEFHEKLQELRKNRGLTQEELAAALYVSRTAISKWESGRGYPSIDSLKELSRFFSVSIDDLLSSEELLDAAREESEARQRTLFDLFFGAADLGAVALILLPLYPEPMGSFIASVDLCSVTGMPLWLRLVHWLLAAALIGIGAVKVILNRRQIEKGRGALTQVSLILSIAAVLFLILVREPYAAAVVFLLLIGKGALVWSEGRSER